MTNEKAIEILKGAIKKPNTKDGYLGQAIDMAIKALEQEPKTDTWSIKEVANALEKHGFGRLEQEPCEVSEYDKDHIWYKGCQYISLRRFLEVKKEPELKTDVLDKIRAEIEQLRLHKAQFLTSDNKVCINSQEVLDIIDKYRQEG